MPASVFSRGARTERIIYIFIHNNMVLYGIANSRYTRQNAPEETYGY